MSSETEYLPGTSRRANDQVRAYEASDGAEQGDMRGVPVIILTTRGRKSGALRKVPLMRVTDGERYAVILLTLLTVSGTENVAKVYAESFRGEEHLAKLLDEAQALVASVTGAA